MPALNFKAEFAPEIVAGRKTQTIRAPRRDGRPTATVGSRLYLYSGLRTKGARKLGEAVCTRTAQVVITVERDLLINGRRMLPTDADLFAMRDGFKCESDLIDWFASVHGLPFEGSLIEWDQTEEPSI